MVKWKKPQVCDRITRIETVFLSFILFALNILNIFEGAEEEEEEAAGEAAVEGIFLTVCLGISSRFVVLLYFLSFEYFVWSISALFAESFHNLIEFQVGSCDISGKNLLTPITSTWKIVC